MTLPMQLRARRFGALAWREGSRLLMGERTVYVERRVDEYRTRWLEAARLLGARWRDVAPGIWEVTHEGRAVRLAGHVVGVDDPVALRLAGDKPACLKAAASLRIPVPEHHLFTLTGLEDAAARIAADPGPWVVKPARSSASGLGVTTGITTPAAFRRAAVLASLQGAEMLLERTVPGESCRLLFLDGELLHAVRRRGARVQGDGVHTVSELAAPFGDLLRDPDLGATLAAQCLALDDVPAAGRSVLLRGVPRVSHPRVELRTVYDESITGRVHPLTVARLGRLTRLLGCRFAGVDLVTVDPAIPLSRAGGAFLEVNTTPGVHHHEPTDEDRSRRTVAVSVLRRLLRPEPERPGVAVRATPIQRRVVMSDVQEAPAVGVCHSTEYLERIGVPRLPAALSPFDPGYDPVTTEAHLAQSHALMSLIKISMACWLVADEAATRAKVAAARRWGVPAVTGGGPFEVAVQQGALGEYLDLVADFGFTRVECGEGFTDLTLSPGEVVRQIHARGLEAQFELGKKHGGAFTSSVVDGLIEQGRRWLDAGALQLVVEARESARGVGLFDDEGRFNPTYADRFAAAFGLDLLIFEAPNKASQFALLDHFGTQVHLCNVRLEEVLRVEIYRRGLHSDAFQNPRLRPRIPAQALYPTPG